MLALSLRYFFFRSSQRSLITRNESAPAEIAWLERALTAAANIPIVTGNTPAMPLDDAHSGGFFHPGRFDDGF